MKAIHIIGIILLIIGGLNWGLVGAFHFDVVMKIFGDGMVTRIIYILVGLAALWEIFAHRSTCRACNTQAASAEMAPKM